MESGWIWKEFLALDLFAGSGSLGLEALSRGAKKVIFVELVNKNILTIFFSSPVRAHLPCYAFLHNFEHCYHFMFFLPFWSFLPF